MPITPDTLGVLHIELAAVIKIMNYTGLWDADLGWYSQTAIAQSAGTAEYTNCIFTEEEEPPLRVTPVMILSRLILEFWGMIRTPSLPLLWPAMVVPIRVPSMGQIELVSWVWHKIPSDSEAPFLDLGGKWSTPPLKLLPGSLRLIVC